MVIFYSLSRTCYFQSRGQILQGSTVLCQTLFRGDRYNKFYTQSRLSQEVTTSTGNVEKKFKLTFEEYLEKKRSLRNWQRGYAVVTAAAASFMASTAIAISYPDMFEGTPEYATDFGYGSDHLLWN